MEPTCAASGTFREGAEICTSLTIATVSFSLYIYEIRLIARQTSLQHPFFFHFVLLAITNMILWVDVYIAMRLIPHPIFCHFFYPAFSEPTVLLKPLLYGYYVSLAVQMFTVIVICISRMTVVLYPWTAIQFWSGYCIHTIFFIILASFLYWFYLADWGTAIVFARSSNNQRLVLGFIEGWPHISLALPGGIMSIVCLIVIIFTTTVTLLKIYRYGGQVVKAEVNLFWTSTGLAFTTTLASIYTIGSYVFYYTLQDLFITMLLLNVKGWIFDINCCLPAWLLLFTNKQIRKQLLRKHRQVQLVTAVSFNRS